VTPSCGAGVTQRRDCGAYERSERSEWSARTSVSDPTGGLCPSRSDGKHTLRFNSILISLRAGGR
jgi:hypothetical protein